jgi:hypothetical protein
MTHAIVSLTLSTVVALGSAAFGVQAPAPSRPAPPARAKAAPPPAAFFEGTVLGPDGKPVADSVIVVSAPADPVPPIIVRTGADGRFKVQARRRGPHTIRIEARGLAAQRIEKVVPGAPLRVTLARGGSIEGVVREAGGGQAVAGARVEAREDGMLFAAPLWEPEVGVVATQTDAKGLFKLEGLARGRHTVTASNRAAGRASQAGVPLGGRVELLLVAGPSIGGRVLTPDGKPAAGAAVRAESEMWSGKVWSAVTDAGGRFDISGLAPGEYRLIAHHKDWAVAIVGGVRLERAGDVEADLVLSAPVRVTGRLVDSDERPLTGTVSLQEADGQPSPQSLGLLVRADAGDDGRFTLERVPSGSHALAVVARGVAARRVPIEVGAGQKAVDLGDVVLEAGAQIRGRVRDTAGAPIADAALHGYPDGPLAAGASPIEGRTGADGTFALGGASAPSYRLHVRAPGFGAVTHPVEAPSKDVELVLEPAGTIEGLVVDDAGRPVEAFDVSAMPAGGRQAMDRQPPRKRPVVSEGGRFTLDEVAAGTYAVQVAARDLGRQVVSDVKVAAGAVTDLGRIRLTAGGAIRGTVVDAASAPIAGAIVVAVGSGRPMSRTDVPETATDSGGGFHLRGLSAGTVVVTARHPDFAEGRSAPVEIEPARTAETLVVLTRGGRIEGIIRRRGGTILPDLRIHLRPLSSAGGFSEYPGATPGPDGSFVIDRVPPGRVGVSLMTPSAPGSGMGTGFFKEIDVREGETARVEFVWREILLSGKVTRAGAPLPNVRLTAMATGSSMYWGVTGGVPAPSSGPQRMTAVTREDGSYEMIVSEAGRVTIRAQSTLGRTATYPVRAIEVADVESQTADLDFPAGGISGIVVDDETEAPIARASVFATTIEPGGLGGGHATAGADGRFSLDVDPGEFRLRASAEGYATDGVAVTVGESPVSDVRLALTRGARLRGKVVGIHGGPAPGVWVMVREETDEGMGASGESSSLDGRFEFPSLRPGRYSLSGGSPLSGYGMLTGVSPGDADVVLRLSPGGRIRVGVKAADGSPLAGAFVSVRRVNGAHFSFRGAGGRTGPDGTVEVDSPAGAIEIEARKDKLSGRGQATVSAGGLAAAEVTLTEAPPAP